MKSAAPHDPRAASAAQALVALSSGDGARGAGLGSTSRVSAWRRCGDAHDRYGLDELLAGDTAAEYESCRLGLSPVGRAIAKPARRARPAKAAPAAGRDARVAFVRALFHKRAGLAPGFVACRLCRARVWAPNGRYHVETCAEVLRERRAAMRERRKVRAVRGVQIPPEEAFERPARRGARMGKVPGFVVVNPLREIENAEGSGGGKKGYVSCVVCSSVVWAPNSARHRLQCPMRAGEAPVRVEEDMWQDGESELDMLFCHEVLDDSDRRR